MARIKIELPENFIFSTEIPLRITDINYGGHLGNDSVLSIAHEARIRFFDQHGFKEKDVGGAGIIMVDAAVQYNAEGFYGDVLIIELGIRDITKTGCDIVYQVTNKKNGKSVAVVKTGIVFFDYQKRKVVPIPGEFLSAIKD
ncbi:MAG: thioesterase family protein [Ignavibacterium sp.]|nr:MAG: thioesterase family protein [Ignavibacterium sp.]